MIICLRITNAEEATRPEDARRPRTRDARGGETKEEADSKEVAASRGRDTNASGIARSGESKKRDDSRMDHALTSDAAYRRGPYRTRHITTW